MAERCYPKSEVGVTAERSNLTSKEWRLSGHRMAKRSYSMFKVRRGSGEEIPLVQGKRKVVAEPQKTQGFLASRGEEFNPGPEMRLDLSEVLCNKVLLKYKGDRERF